MEPIDPWGWKPPLRSWFERVGERAAQWSPRHIELDGLEGFRTAVASAAADQADWLYHAFCTPLCGDGALSATFGEAQLVGWAAARAPGLDGVARIAADQTIWSQDGHATQVCGHVRASELAALIANGPASEMTGRRPVVLQRSVEEASACRFIRDGMEELFSALPCVDAWLCGTTRTLDLLPQRYFSTAPEGALVSCSSPEVPAFIRVSPCLDLLKLLEMIVHETAHHCLFLHEMNAPLISESSEGVFSSPLRHEPRPLRGILLAAHACAYIAAAYAEAQRSPLKEAVDAEGERFRVLALFEESREIIAEGVSHLTRDGLEFVKRTDAVAAYACGGRNRST